VHILLPVLFTTQVTGLATAPTLVVVAVVVAAMAVGAAVMAAVVAVAGAVMVVVVAAVAAGATATSASSLATGHQPAPTNEMIPLGAGKWSGSCVSAGAGCFCGASIA
jgi:hypothetical protein